MREIAEAVDGLILALEAENVPTKDMRVVLSHEAFARLARLISREHVVYSPPTQAVLMEISGVRFEHP